MFDFRLKTKMTVFPSSVICNTVLNILNVSTADFNSLQSIRPNNIGSLYCLQFRAFTRGKTSIGQDARLNSVHSTETG